MNSSNTRKLGRFIDVGFWGVLGVWLLSLGLAQAGSVGAFQAYDATQISEIKKAGKPLAIVFTKDACPNCKKQVSTLKELINEKEIDSSIAIFQVDFEKQKDLVKMFDVSGQSTIVLFKGEEQRSKTRGLVKRDAILAEFSKLR